MTLLPQYREEPTTDKLIGTIEIQLTHEQHTYLQENKETPRTLLLKKFNLKFGTTYSKLQMTRALEIMNEVLVYRSNHKKDAPNNVYYKPRDKCWEARITVNKKRILLYTGSKEKAIQAVAEWRRKK